jgi:ATP sulfurylase
MPTNGTDVPTQFSRPEVLAILRQSCAGQN